MRIKIAQQQSDLKEHHAGVPNRSRSAEPWQDDFGDQRLNLKEQEGPKKDYDAVSVHDRSEDNVDSAQKRTPHKSTPLMAAPFPA